MANSPTTPRKTPFFHASRPMMFGIMVLSFAAFYIVAALFGAWLFNKMLCHFKVKGWIRAYVIPLFLVVMFCLPFYGHIMGKLQLAYYKDKYPPISEVYKTVHSDSYVVVYPEKPFYQILNPIKFNRNLYIYIYKPHKQEEYYSKEHSSEKIATTDVLSKSRYHIYLTSEQVTDRLQVREQRIVDATTEETLGRYRDLRVRLGTDYFSAQGGDDYQLYPSTDDMDFFNYKVIFPLTDKEAEDEPTP